MTEPETHDVLLGEAKWYPEMGGFFIPHRRTYKLPLTLPEVYARLPVKKERSAGVGDRTH